MRPGGAALPVGLLVDAPFDEDGLIQIMVDVQAHTDYLEQIPTLLRSAA